jgi:Secretion system C-terminal sorting domain
MISYSSQIFYGKMILCGLVIILSLLPTEYIAQNLLDQPQEIVIDTERNRYLVSNFQNEGDLVQVDSLGNQSYFVENAGMNDAMQIVGNTIYGSGGDNGRVLGFDLETGDLVMELYIAGTDHISGFEADSLGILYVSERFGSRIFKINPKTNEYWVFAEGQGIQEPNGLLYEPEKNRLLVLIDQPEKPTYAINLTDSTVYTATTATATLNGSDGIAKDKYGNYYITGYELPGVYRFDSTFNSSAKLIFKGNSIIYPNYDSDNHSLLLTHYFDDEWSCQSLLNPILPSLFTASNFEDGIKLQWENPSTHLDGTPLNDFKVLIYRDENLIDSLSQNLTDISQVREYVDNIEGLYSYKIKIKDNEMPMNYSQFTDELLAFGGQFFSDYSNDFEDGIGQIHHTGLWDTTSHLVSSGLCSITDSPDSNYQKYQNTYISIPPRIIEPGVSLKFDHIGTIRVPSMGYVEISKDYGNSYISLMSVQIYLYDEWKDSSADEGDWKTEIIDLSDFQGDTVMIRFRLNTGRRADMDGWYIDNIELGKITGINNAPDDILPNIFDLKQNYPNPFNPTTTIKYSIPKRSGVTIKVFDVMGREVITLVNKEQPQGYYEIEFDASDFTSGIYFYQLQTSDIIETSKMIFLK